MRRREHAFTLIELLMVVLIVGILASVAIPTYAAQKKSGADARALSLLRVAMDAAGQYYMAHGESYEGLLLGHSPPARNLFADPAASALTYWRAYVSGTLTLPQPGTVRYLNDNYGVQIASTVSGNAFASGFPVTPGETHTFAFDFEPMIANTYGYRATVRYWDVSGVQIQAQAGPYVAKMQTGRFTAWLTTTAPDGAVRAGFFLYGRDSGDGQMSVSMDIHRAGLAKGTPIVLNSGNDPGWTWDGPPGASTSSEAAGETLNLIEPGLRAALATAGAQPGADAPTDGVYVGQDNQSLTGDGTGAPQDRPSASRIVICSVSRGKRTYCARATSGRWEYAASTGPISSTTSYRTEGWS